MHVLESLYVYQGLVCAVVFFTLYYLSLFSDSFFFTLADGERQRAPLRTTIPCNGLSPIAGRDATGAGLVLVL